MKLSKNADIGEVLTAMENAPDEESKLVVLGLALEDSRKRRYFQIALNPNTKWRDLGLGELGLEGIKTDKHNTYGSAETSLRWHVYVVEWAAAADANLTRVADAKLVELIYGLFSSIPVDEAKWLYKTVTGTLPDKVKIPYLVLSARWPTVWAPVSYADAMP